MGASLLYLHSQGKQQRDRRKLREKRRSTGVVHLARSFLIYYDLQVVYSSLSPRPYRVRLGNAMPKITLSVKTKPVKMVHDCISPDILCVMGDDIRDHKTRETDNFKTFNTGLSNHTYNWFFPTICFYLYCNFDASLTWLLCSYMKRYLTVKTFISTSVISSRWEDVNLKWIGKQTLMPVQIGNCNSQAAQQPKQYDNSGILGKSKPI